MIIVEGQGLLRWLWGLFAGYVACCAMLGLGVFGWSQAQRLLDPQGYVARQREYAAEARAIEVTRLQREAAEEAAVLAAMSPAERADAYAAALDPAERSEAEQEVSAAGLALYSARAAAPADHDDVVRLRAEEQAAERRWRSAMERLYGPTWDAYQQRLEGQASHAVAGRASSLGY